MIEINQFVDSHLNLQVKIAYNEHHDFLIRHGLLTRTKVLDVGTGNGHFAQKLALEHPVIEFVGIDKRKHLVENCKLKESQNFKAELVDLFAKNLSFNFSSFDGILMRYFLLHVDHAEKILDLFIRELNGPSIFWIIDLDWSQITCSVEHPSFFKFKNLIKDFTERVSISTQGGNKIVPLLKQFGFHSLQVENIPFSSSKIQIEDFTLYLKQEIICYSKMLGRDPKNSDLEEIMLFLDEYVLTKKVELSYGMILVSAQLR